MSGVYTVTLQNQALTAARTLVAVMSTAAVVFEVLDCWITNEDIETSEQWGAQIVELTANDGTYSAQTPRLLPLGL
jgi:hypothetical protein